MLTKCPPRGSRVVSRTNPNLSRRQAIGALVAAGGCGTGTTFLSAGPSRHEQAAGDRAPAATGTELRLAWRKVTETNQVETSSSFPIPTADTELPASDLSDVTPGDRGWLDVLLWPVADPALVSLTGSLPDETADGAQPRRESVDQSSSPIHVGETIETRISYLEQDDDSSPPAELATTTACIASLATIHWLGTAGSGLQLDGACTASVPELLLGDATPAPFEPETVHGVRMEWLAQPTTADWQQPSSESFRFGFDATPVSDTRSP